jgi:hypothetical protein
VLFRLTSARRSGRGLIWATLLLIAISGSGCDNGGFTATTSHELRTLTGRLVAGSSAGPDRIPCAWLEDAAGNRTTVFYPDGWDVLFDPVRLIDPKGEVFASAGDFLTVTGPTDGVGGSVCSSVMPFFAVKVERGQP